MTNQEFGEQLKQIRVKLLELKKLPNWEEICREALEDGELTLSDALMAVSNAAGYSFLNADD
jgi:hypothetical protein